MNTRQHTAVVQRDHLAGFAFRPAPVAPSDPPAAVDGPWTYERTLAELRRRGAQLVDADPGVRVVDRRRLPAVLARALEANGPALRCALRLGVLDGSVPAPWAARGWDDATQLHAAWFGLAFSPQGNVELGAGRSATDLGRFRAAVAQRLAAGPDAAGAASLARDLASLYRLHGPSQPALRVLRTTRPLAA